MRIPLTMLIVILLTYFIFQPRLLNYVFPSARSASVSHMLDSAKNQNHLDSQLYWETREFYYPGVFYVYRDGLEDKHIAGFTKDTGLNLQTEGTFPILVYKSNKWMSYESLVNTSDLGKLVDVVGSTVLYEDKETKILKDGDRTYIYFIKNYDELKTTNGFIYTKEEILKDYRYWFGVSVVTK